MIYCFDTYYFGEKANTACLGFSDWDSDTILFEKNEITTGIKEYESGAFYKRELPCIINIIDKMNLNNKLDLIIIDGYVVLDDNGKLGLGGFLFEHLNEQIPIIGVAKNDYSKLQIKKREVFRGNSKKALFVSAKGIDLDFAAQKVRSMHGKYRIPTVLKALDQKSRYII